MVCADEREHSSVGSPLTTRLVAERIIARLLEANASTVESYLPTHLRKPRWQKFWPSSLILDLLEMSEGF